MEKKENEELERQVGERKRSYKGNDKLTPVYH